MWYDGAMSDIPWFPVLPSWFKDGACVGKDPNLFEPSATNATSSAPWRSICRDCPIRSACQEYAVKHESYGNWGGLTSKERDQLRKIDLLKDYQSLSVQQTYEIPQGQVVDELDVEFFQHSPAEVERRQTKEALADLSIDDLLLLIL